MFANLEILRPRGGGRRSISLITYLKPYLQTGGQCVLIDIRSFSAAPRGGVDTSQHLQPFYAPM